MAELKVSDKMILFDDEDGPVVSEHTWHLTADGHVATCVVRDGKRISVRMHRFLLEPPKGTAVYHRNGNRLDYRRDNLVVVSASEIQRLHRKKREKTSEWK